MKTNELAKTTFVDDGECLSFHTFSSSGSGASSGSDASFSVSGTSSASSSRSDTSSFTFSGFELLVLSAGDYVFTVGGKGFEMAGPQVLLMGPGLEHGWKFLGDGGRSGSGGCDGLADGLAIRWPADLLGTGFLGKQQTKAISVLLDKAAFGVRFSPAVLPAVRRRLEALRDRTGFTIYLELLGLLHELSLAEGEALLSTLPAAGSRGIVEKKSRIEDVMMLMQTNYFRPMTLEEMARKACMTKGSFCRSFRKKTGKTYSETLNEIRLGHICRLLAETTDSVSEIAYRAGYQNIHHFHRHFKRQKGCTPLEYRDGVR